MLRSPALPCLALALLVATGCRSADEPRDVAGEIKAAAVEFDLAQLHSDGAALDRFLAPDFVLVRGSGKVADRKEFIATFTDPNVRLDPFTIQNPIFVQLGPDSGLVGGEAVLSGTESGKRFSEHLRYADIFVKRDGHWQVVYAQVTLIP